MILRIQVFSRLVALILFMLIPFSLIGFLFFGINGIGVGMILSLIFFLVFTLFPEEMISKIHRARADIPPGLQITLERVIDARLPVFSREKSFKKPKLLIFPDPSPNALICKGFGNPGTILLSQGMVALLGEADLREAIRVAVDRLRHPGMTLASTCALFSWGLLKVSPRPLTPLGAIRYLLVFPLIQLFSYLGNFSFPFFQFNTSHKHQSFWRFVSRPGFLNLILVKASP